MAPFPLGPPTAVLASSRIKRNGTVVKQKPSVSDGQPIGLKKTCSAPYLNLLKYTMNQPTNGENLVRACTEQSIGLKKA